MKKLKVFFVAAGLLIATAGVFATKSFTDTYTVYAYATNTGTYTAWESSLITNKEIISKVGSATPVAFTSQTGGTCVLEYYDVSTPSVAMKPVYSDF